MSNSRQSSSLVELFFSSSLSTLEPKLFYCVVEVWDNFFLQCSFSNGGHLFAAVHGNVIQLYSSTTFENVGNLKGHNGKVT